MSFQQYLDKTYETIACLLHAGVKVKLSCTVVHANLRVPLIVDCGVEYWRDFLYTDLQTTISYSGFYMQVNMFTKCKLNDT